MHRHKSTYSQSNKNKFVAAFFLLAFNLFYQSIAIAAPYELAWDKLNEDLDVAQVTVPQGALFSSELVLFRSSLLRYRIGVIRASEYGWYRNTARALGRESRATLAINANFFDEKGKALGLVISRGIISQSVHKGGSTLSGIFSISSSGPVIINRSQLSPHGILEAVQAGPRLLVNGEPVKGIRDPDVLTKRSGICIDREKRVVIYCVSSGLLGVSISQLQSILTLPSVGCEDALNLDGGGSSQLYLNVPESSTFKELFIEGTDTIPVALGLFPINQSIAQETGDE